MDDIDYLIALLSDIEYPPGIRGVTPGRIQRVAFFPGGTGLIQGRVLPRHGTLVLGHNFYNVASYEQSVQQTREIGRNPTWANLLPFLQRCCISPSDCFFTNAMLGLIETNSATGSHPGHRKPEFRAACRRVLSASIERQQPRLILALGMPATRMLGEVIPGLEAWSKATTFPRFDAGRMCEAGLDLSCPKSGTPLAAVVLVHPSFRASNLRHRSFENLIGDEAEVAMVRRAMVEA